MMQELRESGREIRPRIDDFWEHLGRDGGVAAITTALAHRLAQPSSLDPLKLMLGEVGESLVLLSQEPSGWQVVSAEGQAEPHLGQLLRADYSLGDKAKLAPITTETPYLVERAWLLLWRQGLTFTFASPNSTSMADYLRYIRQGREDTPLETLMAKGLTLLTTVESLLYKPDTDSNRLDEQRDYLASLPKNDFLLYRATRVGRDEAVAALLKEGMGFFKSKTVRLKWLRCLGKAAIPTWEVAALSHRYLIEKSEHY
jgi:hypothetical protein